jgi:proliferating cell nuclear antigen
MIITSGPSVSDEEDKDEELEEEQAADATTSDSGKIDSPEAEPSVEEEDAADSEIDEQNDAPESVDDDPDAEEVSDDEAESEPTSEDSNGSVDVATGEEEETVEADASPEADVVEDEPEANASGSEVESPEQAPKGSAEADVDAESASEQSAEALDADSANDNSAAESDTDTTAESGSPEAGSEADSDGIATEEVDHPPNHLSATIEASELANFLNNTSVLVEECKIRTSPSGLRIRAVDPANVSMVDTTLDASAFESYDTTAGVLGVYLDRLEEVVNLANSGDVISLDYNPDTRKVELSTNGIDYTLALLDPDSIRQEPELPALDLACELEVEAGPVARGVKAATMVSEHIEFRAVPEPGNDHLVIAADGDTDDVNLTVGQEELLSSSFGQEAGSLFSLDYMEDIKKALPKSGELRLELGHEFPLKIHFSGCDGAMQTEFMLAPRISSD